MIDKIQNWDIIMGKYDNRYLVHDNGAIVLVKSINDHTVFDGFKVRQDDHGFIEYVSDASNIPRFDGGITGYIETYAYACDNPEEAMTVSIVLKSHHDQISAICENLKVDMNRVMDAFNNPMKVAA